MVTLPPCLMPDIPESQKNDSEVMSCRYLDIEEEIQKINHEIMTSNYIAENLPIIFVFYPSEEVLKNLILRMIQIKDEE